MKSLVTVSVIAGCAGASVTPISASTEALIKSSCSGLKKKLADENFCPPSLSFDVHVMIDGTAEAAELGEYWNDSIIPNLNQQMQREFPGSRFAVSWFRDKPYAPVGAPTDTCFSMATDFTDSEATLLDVAHARDFTGGTAPGGGDEMYNAQGQAILSAVQYSELSWRESVLARPPGDTFRSNVIKQMVLITYTKSHNPKDGQSTVPELPSMIDNTYDASGDPEVLCREQDYPDISKAIVNSHDMNYTNFVALVPYDRPEVVNYWKSIGSDVDPSDKGYFKVGVVVEDWESNLLDLFMMFINSALNTCGHVIDPTLTPSTEFPTSTTATTGEPTTTTTETTGTTESTTGTTTTTGTTESTTGTTTTTETIGTTTTSETTTGTTTATETSGSTTTSQTTTGTTTTAGTTESKTGTTTTAEASGTTTTSETTTGTTTTAEASGTTTTSETTTSTTTTTGATESTTSTTTTAGSTESKTGTTTTAGTTESTTGTTTTSETTPGTTTTAGTAEFTTGTTGTTATREATTGATETATPATATTKTTETTTTTTDTAATSAATTVLPTYITANTETVASTPSGMCNCTGHGCCDGIEFRAQGKIKHVDMELQWAERVRRLLSSIAW